MKNELQVPFIDQKISSAQSISAVFDSNNVAFQSIDTLNWSDYNYCPDVKFRIAHNGDAIYLEFVVNEKSIRALCPHDGEPVYMDSCVEFFLQPQPNTPYYNYEFNCAGKLDYAARRNRTEKQAASTDNLASVLRYSSIADRSFEERDSHSPWILCAIIPKEACFVHQIDTFKGKVMKGNFYKCGDGLTTPHYVTWMPIKTEKPDYHQPDFFGTLVFE